MRGFIFIFLKSRINVIYCSFYKNSVIMFLLISKMQQTKLLSDKNCCSMIIKNIKEIENRRAGDHWTTVCGCSFLGRQISSDKRNKQQKYCQVFFCFAQQFACDPSEPSCCIQINYPQNVQLASSTNTENKCMCGISVKLLTVWSTLTPALQWGPPAEELLGQTSSWNSTGNRSDMLT